MLVICPESFGKSEHRLIGYLLLAKVNNTTPKYIDIERPDILIINSFLLHWLLLWGKVRFTIHHNYPEKPVICV